MNKLSNYKELRNNKSLFDEAMSTDVLNNLGNPLDALSRLVDFEQFRPTLESALFTGERKEQSRSSAVRLRTDVQGAISSALLRSGRPSDTVSDYRPHQFS